MEGGIMHPELDKLELPELVDRLDDMEGRRTPVGWKPEDAVMRSAIERRILQLVSSEPPADERRDDLRLPCELAVKVRTKKTSIRAQTKDLGVGGVFVQTAQALGVGTPVEIEVRGHGTDEYGLKVRGHVSWIAQKDGDDGVGVSFSHDANERNERRLRRFIIELLRHRLVS
jgi:Tfp pilus assembly protein PilZ